MENGLPAGLLHRLPAGADLGAHAGIHSVHPVPGGLPLPLAGRRNHQFPVSIHTLGRRHPDRVLGSRLLRGRTQIFTALKYSSLTIPSRICQVSLKEYISFSNGFFFA